MRWRSCCLISRSFLARRLLTVFLRTSKWPVFRFFPQMCPGGVISRLNTQPAGASVQRFTRDVATAGA
jgi:hypothetical protein